MSVEAKKYFAYARECARQADQATNAERRDKLLELARVWTIAALTEANVSDGNTRAGQARGLSR
jgi:hypothetical protein